MAFYNLDNLFDTIDDTSHNDDEFTPKGKYQWTKERYRLKLKNMNKVICAMVDEHAPDVLGVCELESYRAFNDLMQTKGLKGLYSIVHFDSKDERGIDVALTFKKSQFTFVEAKNYAVKMSLDSNDRTRDILHVKLKSSINNDTFDFIVCHFPSRREGKMESEQNRLDAAGVVKWIKDNRCGDKIIIMGDFNDQPWDKSLFQVIGAMSKSKCPECPLQNLMFELPDGEGSYRYRGHWERLDQIIVSKALRDGKGADYLENSVTVFQTPWMIQTGQYAGYPLRTFGGAKWLNGYSDHLPVYMKLIFN